MVSPIVLVNHVARQVSLGHAGSNGLVLVSLGPVGVDVQVEPARRGLHIGQVGPDDPRPPVTGDNLDNCWNDLWLGHVWETGS